MDYRFRKERVASKGVKLVLPSGDLEMNILEYGDWHFSVF